MDTQHVAESPEFAVRLPWKDLDTATVSTIPLSAEGYARQKIKDVLLTAKLSDRVLSASWPSGCCVCGNPSTHTDTLVQNLTLGPERIGRDRKLTIRIVGIPYCDAHSEGVNYASIPGEKGRFIKFRSYSYQTKFRQSNPWTHDIGSA